MTALIFWSVSERYRWSHHFAVLKKIWELHCSTKIQCDNNGFSLRDKTDLIARTNGNIDYSIIVILKKINKIIIILRFIDVWTLSFCGVCSVSLINKMLFLLWFFEEIALCSQSLQGISSLWAVPSLDNHQCVTLGRRKTKKTWTKPGVKNGFKWNYFCFNCYSFLHKRSKYISTWMLLNAQYCRLSTVVGWTNNVV